MDGAQRQGRRRRRRRVREVTGRRTLGYNIEALPDPAALLENKTPTSINRPKGLWGHHGSMASPRPYSANLSQKSATISYAISAARKSLNRLKLANMQRTSLTSSG